MSAYRDWHVGMKVVCLRASAFDDRYHGPGEQLPVEGGVYTIREIGTHHPDYPNEITIRLRECVNRPWLRWGYDHRIEIFFYAKDYKPLHKRATDISIFTAMLTDQRRKVDA